MTDTRLREAAQALVDWYDQGVKWHTARHMIDPLRAALAAPAAVRCDIPACNGLHEPTHPHFAPAAPLDEERLARALHDTAPRNHNLGEGLLRAVCPDSSWHNARANAIATAYREDKA